MARGRMVSNSLGRSDKFGQLPTDQDRLLYVLMLTFADAEGRIEIIPRDILADCMPWSSATQEWVMSSCAAMHEVGLIELYLQDGKTFAQFVNFHNHNYIARVKNGERKGDPSREAPSKLPEPTGKHPGWQAHSAATHEQVMTDSRVTHANTTQGGRPPGSLPAGAREAAPDEGTGGRPDGAPPSENEDPPDLAARLANLPEGTHDYIRKTYWRNQQKSEGTKRLEAFTLALQRGEA